MIESFLMGTKYRLDEMKQDRYKIKIAAYTYNGSKRYIKEVGGVTTQRINFGLKSKGDMAKLVDATDLIGLSLGMETY